MNTRIPLWIVLSGVSVALIEVCYILDIVPVKVSAYLGLGFLVLTLVPVHFRKLVRYRRDFGITAGVISVLHFFFALLIYFNLSLNQLFSKAMPYGTLALIVLVILLITSNYALQRKLGNKWRQIHAFVWFALPLVLVHAYVAALMFEGGVPVLAIVIMGCLVIFGFIKLFMPNTNNKDAIRDIVLIVVGFLVAIGIYIVLSSRNIKPTSVNDNTNPTDVTLAITQPTSEVSQQSNQNIAPTNINIFTPQDLASHNSISDCYIAFQGLVYDVTSYLPMHPGGERKALPKCGQAIDNFDSMHSGGSFASSKIQTILKPLSIGQIQ